jgi:hypothetical protein
MKGALLFLWQLPQNLLGLLLVHMTGARRWQGGGGLRPQWLGSPRIYLVRDRDWLPGVSLGAHIILSESHLNAPTLAHEYGHSRQSRAFGPLYLLVVGLPSVLRNLWDRAAHGHWTPAERDAWYYGAYPEHQADRFGGVGSR